VIGQAQPGHAADHRHHPSRVKHPLYGQAISSPPGPAGALVRRTKARA
jgi:hypothetical protein